jgi:hypothetical protein
MPSEAGGDDLTAMDPSTTELPGRPRAKDSAALDHATQLILRVCRIAGSASFVDDAREALAAEGVHAAVRTRNTTALFRTGEKDQSGEAAWQSLRSCWPERSWNAAGGRPW